MTAVLAWLRGLLIDPTSPMHLNAFLLVNAELVRHFRTGQPYDLNIVWAAAVLFGSGGAIDIAQKLMALRGGKLP